MDKQFNLFENKAPAVRSDKRIDPAFQPGVRVIFSHRGRELHGVTTEESRGQMTTVLIDGGRNWLVPNYKLKPEGK